MKRLILFDIDGTILSTNGAATRAFHRALLATYGTAGPIANHPFDGKTDRQIARELLRMAGLDDATITRSFQELWTVYLRALAAELGRPDSRMVVHPGVAELLDRLAQMQEDFVVGLLTGNIEAGATIKLSAVRLEHHFRFGAFGSDSEHREELPAVAVERARALTGQDYRGHDQSQPYARRRFVFPQGLGERSDQVLYACWLVTHSQRIRPTRAGHR